MQQTSKWQTHLPYSSRLQNLKVHNVLCMTTIKTQTVPKNT